MKVYKSLSLIFENSENMIRRGAQNDFENEYLYVHRTLLKQHIILQNNHEQLPRLSERFP